LKVKPVVARELANHDIDEIIAYYLGESAEQAAYGFIDALEDAYAHIGRHPATGSPRYAHPRIEPARSALLAIDTLSASRVLR
jgi:toxin ParE1/3/4